MKPPKVSDLLGEYDRYLEASPHLADHARLILAERIIRQIRRSEEL